MVKDGYGGLWMLKEGLRWLQIDGDSNGGLEIARDGYGWLEMALDCWRWLWIDGDGDGLLEMARDSQRWLWMARDSYGWLWIAGYGYRWLDVALVSQLRLKDMFIHLCLLRQARQVQMDEIDEMGEIGLHFALLARATSLLIGMYFPGDSSHIYNTYSNRSPIKYYIRGV